MLHYIWSFFQRVFPMQYSLLIRLQFYTAKRDPNERCNIFFNITCNAIASCVNLYNVTRNVADSSSNTLAQMYRMEFFFCNIARCIA